MLYPLDEILLLSLCGVVSGCGSFVDVALYGEEKLGGLRPCFRTVRLLTLCGHFPSHIVERLLRRLVSDGGVTPLPVVEDLDIFEDCSLGFRRFCRKVWQMADS